MIVKNLSKSFNSNKILDNISFVLEDNDKVCLIGNNGAGKSTLLKSIANLIEYRGTIKFDGVDSNKYERKSFAGRSEPTYKL